MVLRYKHGMMLIIVAFFGCGYGTASEEQGVSTKQVIKERPRSVSLAKESTVIEDKSVSQDLSLLSTLPNSIHQKMQGRWELVSYQVKDGEDYMEVPITPSPLDLVEYWVFKKSSYRRIMDEKLSFSASYTLLKSEKRTPMFDGIHFILHAKKVRSSIPGVKRPEEFFYGILSDDSLILFYLGATLKKQISLSQGHMYEKK